MNSCVDCGIDICGRSTRCGVCAAKARWRDSEYRKKTSAAISQGQRDNYSSDPVKRRETLDRMSFAMKSNWADPDNRERYTKALALSWEGDEERRFAASVAGRRRYEDPREREKTSLANIKRFKDPNERLKISDSMCKTLAERRQCSKPLVSKLEVDVCGVIEDCDIECVPQYKPVGSRWVFDIYLPDYRMLVEVDGEFWHHSDWAKERGVPEKDAKKDQWAVDNGYDIARIREGDLYEYGIECVVEEFAADLGAV